MHICEAHVNVALRRIVWKEQSFGQIWAASWENLLNGIRFHQMRRSDCSLIRAICWSLPLFADLSCNKTELFVSENGFPIMGLKISTKHYRNNPWINTEPLSMPLFHISALCVTFQRYMSFICQKTCCTFSRRLVRRFGHTPSVTLMRRSHPRRIVLRSAGVCSVGVCRGFSGLKGSVPRTPGAGWAPQGQLRVVEGGREGRTSGWLSLRWRSGGCAILLRRYLSSLAVGELTTSSGTMLRCQATSYA